MFLFMTYEVIEIDLEYFFYKEKEYAMLRMLVRI